MCNHYRIGNGQMVLEFAKLWSSPEARDETADNSPWTPAAEVWPWANTHMAVIYRVPTGPALVFMRWACGPPYEPTKKFVSNTRDDGLTTKSLWKKSVVERRCLVAADGFYVGRAERRQMGGAISPGRRATVILCGGVVG